MEQATKIVGRLQTQCAQVFDEVIQELQPGMSEFDIAEKIRQVAKHHDITDWWYDVPIVILIGTDRFSEGNTTTDYTIKEPSKRARLEEGSSLFIDLHPMDSATKQWGDWANIVVFRPRKPIDDEQLAFFDEFRHIQREGIARMTAQTTGADVARFYLDEYGKRGITLQDVRNNMGHSIHTGPKSEARRIWLDLANTAPLGEGIFAVEPGGFRPKKDGSGIVVGRFEVCVYIPANGSATILGEQ